MGIGLIAVSILAFGGAIFGLVGAIIFTITRTNWDAVLAGYCGAFVLICASLLCASASGWYKKDKNGKDQALGGKG